MSTILEKIAESTRIRVEKAKLEVPLEKLKSQALEMNCKTCFPFEKALKKKGLSFICECKKASPSKGIIAESFPYREIAKEYEAAGADAISVLTEPEWFLGKNEYLKEISADVKIPCLRKDFTIDEYMLYEAKLLGASAVLLICSLLDEKAIAGYISICNVLGLSALVEAHNEFEIAMAVNARARIIGVNNRNLSDFSVDIENSQKLRSLVPNDILFVAESGIHSQKEVQLLREAGVDAVLIGEALMREKNKKEALERLRGER